MKEKKTYLKELVTYLKDQGHGHTQKEIAEKLGYKVSSFSQIINQTVKTSDQFIRKILSLEKNINADWLRTGEGNMLNSYSQTLLPVTEVQEKEIFYKTLEASDKQLNDIVAPLLESLSAMNKKCNQLEIRVRQLEENNQLLTTKNQLLKKEIELLKKNQEKK